jgi:hypothetical protein
MNKELILTVIRIMLSVLLGFGVYAETGIWTAVWYVLMLSYVEVQTINERRRNEQNSGG